CRTNKKYSKICSTRKFWEQYFQEKTGEPVPTGLKIKDIIGLLETREAGKELDDLLRKGKGTAIYNKTVSKSVFETLSSIEELNVENQGLKLLPYLPNCKKLHCSDNQLAQLPKFPDSLQE